MRIFMLIILMFLLIPVSPANSQDDPNEAALTWLIEQQEENGSFHDNFWDTGFAAITLGLLDNPNPAAIQYLESSILTNDELGLGAISFVILAAIANDIDVDTLANGELESLLIENLNTDSEEETINLCASILALHALNRELPSEILERIMLAYQENRAFIDIPTGHLDVTTTGFCLPILVLLKDSDELETTLDFLAQNQNDDGSWDTFVDINYNEGVITTIYALLGMNAAGEDLETDWTAALDYLLTFQAENGAFVYSERESFESPAITALALMVLNDLDFLFIENNLDVDTTE